MLETALIIEDRLATDILIRTDDVRKHFLATKGIFLRQRVGVVKAVDGVSITIRHGQTYGIVGESGCGKTTLARMILLAEKPTSGSIQFNGVNMAEFSNEQQREYRASVQAVFQDPFASLNPRMRASSIILELPFYHQRLTRVEAKNRLRQLFSDVGLHTSQADHYPHEFSGGQRQRIAIARALSLTPKVIVLDEPVSALDISIRAQVMNLLKRLQNRYGMAYLLIAHNLATVRYLSDQVGVMYLGKIVEEAPAQELFARPLHPYTKALIAASLPSRPGSKREEVVVSGEIPSPLNPPAGCAFHPRCPFALERCAQITPQWQEVSPGHKVACHLY